MGTFIVVSLMAVLFGMYAVKVVIALFEAFWIICVPVVFTVLVVFAMIAGGVGV